MTDEDYIYDRGMLRRFDCHHDRWVDPNRRVTKSEAPYGYSEFFHWGDRHSARGCQAVYSDRLWQWDYAKMERLSEALGKRFEQATPAELSKLLTDFFDRPHTVTALAEGCNVSNGYPYYILWFREAGK